MKPVLAGVLCLGSGVNAQSPSLILQMGHNSHINDLDVSPDNRLLATAGRDGVIILWRIPSHGESPEGLVVRRLVEHDRAVEAVAFLPGGSRLASISKDRTLRIWDITSGRQLQELRHNFPVIEKLDKVFGSGERSDFAKAVKPRLVALPDERGVVLNDMDGAWLWNLHENTRQRIGRTVPVLRPVSAVAVSPDARSIATGEEKNVSVWSLPRGKRIATFSKGGRMVTSLAYSADGRQLLIGRDSGELERVNVATGGVLQRYCCHRSRISRARFSPDGHSVLSVSGDSLRIWKTTGLLLRTVLPGKVQFGPFSVSSGSDIFVDFGGFSVIGFRPQLNVGLESQPADTVKIDSLATAFFVGEHSFNRFLQVSANRSHALSKSERSFDLWDLASGAAVNSLPNPFKTLGAVSSLALEANAKRLAIATEQGYVGTFDLTSGVELNRRKVANAAVASMVWAGNDTLIIASAKSLIQWQTTTGELSRQHHKDTVDSLAWAPRSRRLVYTLGNRLVIRGARTERKSRSCFWGTHGCHHIVDATFSPDETLVATAGGQLWLWDSATMKGTHLAKTQPEYIYNDVDFSPGGDLLLASRAGLLEIWNVATRSLIRVIDTDATYIEGAVFTPDGKAIWINLPYDGNWQLRKVTGERLATRVSVRDDQSDTPSRWRLVLPTGQFDTNSLEIGRELRWVMPDDPFSPLPVEIFMRDYYEPRLLPRLLAGERLPAIRNVSQLNRVQPHVRIASVEPLPGHPNKAVVTVSVESFYHEGDDRRLVPSGVYDLRLYRDGRLVRQWPEPTDKLLGSIATPEALRAWRRASAIALDWGGRAQRAITVDLPWRSGVSEVEFTAYAFNLDRVKSVTARRSYKLPKVAKAPQRRAYVVTVGVTRNQDPGFTLSFAGRDARLIRDELSAVLSRTGNYEKVIPVPLITSAASISPFEEAGPEPSIEPTKANIRAVLKLLSGRADQVQPAQLAQIPVSIKEELHRARPDDLVVLTFSAHGVTDAASRAFYILPYDLGRASEEKLTATQLGRAISSEELSLWLRDIDAQMALILGTCYAESAVAASGFKPGPLGDPGLGQLAYDKAMPVLVASQSVAWEVSGYGLVAYAFAKEGLKAARQGRAVSLTEVMEYVAGRVPELYREKIKSETIQQATLFDFRERKYEISLSRR